jgi:UDP-N-acetylglucosamine--N-acetylmuramyl-(pentapeptide) pyrophosphoryl-undecaprenol N-acetylglucosamine transferase
MKYLPEGKAVLTGSPIRQELFLGNADAARTLCHIQDTTRPVLLIVGGSSGSKVINDVVRAALPELLEHFSIIHLCGKGNLDPSLNDVKDYTQMEYASRELPDIFALADLVISRAGANSICELLALHKPNILIPLSAAASRGDQILNARSFQKQGFSYVLEEESLSKESLLNAVRTVFADRDTYRSAMEASGQMDSIRTIVDLIISESK